MKRIIFFLFVFPGFSACQKSLENDNTGCTNVVVTLSAPSCKQVGVILNGKKYASDDLPDEYAVEGRNICIEYSFFNDEEKCICCGGTKIHIVAVR